MQLEEQGWFSASAYKSLQGLRVRRGTIFGILLLVGAGIWTMLSHGTLRKGRRKLAAECALHRPASPWNPREMCRADKLIGARFPDWESRPARTIRWLWIATRSRRSTRTSIRLTYVKIIEPGSSDYRSR